MKKSELEKLMFDIDMLLLKPDNKLREGIEEVRRKLNSMIKPEQDQVNSLKRKMYQEMKNCQKSDPDKSKRIHDLYKSLDTQTYDNILLEYIEI